MTIVGVSYGLAIALEILKNSLWKEMFLKKQKEQDRKKVVGKNEAKLFIIFIIIIIITTIKETR